MSPGRDEATADGAGTPSGRSDPLRYLSFYGLKTAPFRVSTDPQYLWPGKSRIEVLDGLVAAVRHGEGVSLLTGDIGTGKTTLVNALVERLTEEGVVVGRMFNFGFEPAEFLHAVARAFGIKDDLDTRLALFAGLQALLGGDAAPARKALLVIDDAQDLSHELLEEIRDLSLAASAHGVRLVILLVGHKKLNAMLSQDRHAALRQRISAGADVHPLTADEVGEYIKYLLRMAGTGDEIFTPEAMLEIAALSGGVPRVINMMCDLALLTGRARRMRTIDGEVVEEARRKLGSPRQIAARRVRSIPQRRPAMRKAGDGTARLVRRRRAAGRAVPVYVSVLALLVLTVATYVLYHGWNASRSDTAPEASRDSEPRNTPAAATAEKPASPELLIERVTHEEPTPLPPRPTAVIPSAQVKSTEPAVSRPSAARRLENPVEPAQRPVERAAAYSTTLPPEPAPSRKDDRREDGGQKDDGPDPGAVIDWLLKEYAGEKR